MNEGRQLAHAATHTQQIQSGVSKLNLMEHQPRKEECMETNRPFNILESTWNLKELMVKNQLLLVYADHISSKNYEQLMDLTETKLKEANIIKCIRKKIVNIIIEAVQNIAKHGHPDRNNMVASLVVIGRENKTTSGSQDKDGESNEDSGRSDDYFVITGNTITSQDKEYLFERLEYLNSLTPDELREYYQHSLRYNLMTEKWGAGLGFLDMMRKAQNKLQFHFTPLNDQHYFFTFKLNVRQPLLVTAA